MNRLEKSTLPTSSPIGGMMTSLTSELMILPKAAPMMIPTAISSTFPRMANSLNSLNILGLLPNQGLTNCRAKRSVTLHLSRGQGLANFGNQPFLDLGGLVGAGREDAASLRHLLEVGFDAQAGAFRGERLERHQIL